MENRDNSFGMKYSILQKFGDTWSEWLQTDTEENAQKMVDSMIARGREAQWVPIGQPAINGAQAALDRQEREHGEMIERMRSELLAQISK